MGGNYPEVANFKTNYMNNFIINNNKGRIEFLDNRFYLTEDGGYVPSVTTILEAYPKDAAYFKWIKDVGADADAIRDEAGRRGSVVHQLTEDYDSGHEVTFLGHDAPKYKMLEWAMFERYVDFSVTHNPIHHIIEGNYISKALGYAGTIDRVCDINGKRTLMDIKTSNSIYPSYWLQLAAYGSLLTEAKVHFDQVAILWLNAKTRTTGKNGAIQGIGWQLVTKSIEEISTDYHRFIATKILWDSLNEDVKPKMISYQLKHKK